MKTIAITGLSGVVGERISAVKSTLLKNYSLVDLFHSKPLKSSKMTSFKLDLLQTKEIFPSLAALQPDIIIHMAAATHIDNCESDISHGKDGRVWKLNVDATQEIVNYCKEYKKKLLFLSSECVFDGGKTGYRELDTRKPKSWYGVTKAEAERIIEEALSSAAIIRGVVAYHDQRTRNKTIFGSFRKLLKNNKSLAAVTDQFFTPTYIDDIWKTLQVILKDDASGVFHVAPSLITTPYQFANDVAQANKYDHTLIGKTTLVQLFGKLKASLRLKNACLDSQKTQRVLGMVYKNVQQVLAESRQ